MFDLKTNACQLLSEHTQSVLSVDVSRDGKYVPRWREVVIDLDLTRPIFVCDDDGGRMIATASKDMTVCIWAATETGAFRYTLSPLVREERERRIGTCVRGREGGGNDDPHAAFFLTGNLFARVPSLTTHALMNLTPLLFIIFLSLL